MEIKETLYVTKRNEWRAWLKKYHRKKTEIWLMYYKKHSGKPRIPYNDAVEEALCFGWIDSTIKKIDDERYAQKYTPRRPGSIWSQLNIERARRMISQKKMTATGMLLYKEAGFKKSARAKIIRKKLSVPEDLKKALSKNKKAKDNFYNFAPSYQKMYIYWIRDAKKKETRERRILRVVDFAEQNKKSVML